MFLKNIYNHIVFSKYFKYIVFGLFIFTFLVGMLVSLILQNTSHINRNIIQESRVSQNDINNQSINISCDEVDQYFSVIKTDVSYDYSKLIPIETNISYDTNNAPGPFISGNVVFGMKYLASIFHQLTNGDYGLGSQPREYPILFEARTNPQGYIYDTFIDTELISDWSNGYLSVIASGERNWFFLAQRPCAPLQSVGVDVCYQKLFWLIQTGHSNFTEIKIPAKYSPDIEIVTNPFNSNPTNKNNKYLKNIVGISNESIFFESNGDDNNYVSYNYSSDQWSETQKNSIEIKKYGKASDLFTSRLCLTYKTIAGDLIFKKGKSTLGRKVFNLYLYEN